MDGYGIVLKGVKTQLGTETDIIKWFRDENGATINKTRQLNSVMSNLTYGRYYGDSGKKIVRVYRPLDMENLNVLTSLNMICKQNLYWERKEHKRMTMEEINEALGYDIEIIPE